MTPQYATNLAAVAPGRQIGLNTQTASPPVSAYVGVDDQLWIQIASAAVNPSAIISARLLMPDGSIVPNQWTVSPPGNRAGFWTSIPLPECFILSIAATLNTSTTSQNMWAQLVISRGNPVGGVISQVLCEGYATNSRAISWPTGVNTDPVNCVGAIRSITGTMPAAGAEISETVPANAKWRIISIQISLTSSATVASRVPTLTFTDGTNIFSRAATSASQPAGQTVLWTWADGLAVVNTSISIVTAPIPRQLYLMPGFKFGSVTGSLQVGDQYAAPQYLVEEWLLP